MRMHILPFHIDDIILEVLSGVGLLTCTKYMWWRFASSCRQFRRLHGMRERAEARIGRRRDAGFGLPELVAGLFFIVWIVAAGVIISVISHFVIKFW